MSDDPSPSASLSLPQVRKAECSKCAGIRNCDIRGHHCKTYEDEHFQAWTNWYILECRGCENVFVQTISTDSESYVNFYEKDGSTGCDYVETARYWPALSKRPKPEWMSDFGIEAPDVDALDAAMVELYGALDNDLRMLAAIGIRTAYDIAAEALGADPDLTFAKKLDSLVTSGCIGVADRDRLEMMVDAGSASAHRGWQPTPAELNTIMDVLEHFIQEAFVAPARRKKLDVDAAEVKKTVPARADKRKKKPL